MKGDNGDTADRASPSAGRSVKQALQAAQAQLAAVSDTPRLDAELLLAHALERDRGFLRREPEYRLTDEAAARFTALLERRRAGEPVAYLIGRGGFWSLELALSPAVLIPRPDTETLVEQALAALPPTSPARALDLGTGSGAVALAIAAERPQAEVWAVERSPAALAVAEANGRALGLSVHWLLGDWFSPLPAELRFDLILSNPPYIAAADPHLAQLRFEPQAALVSGPDGLDDIRHLIRHAPQRLHPGGRLLLEHGWEQGAAVRALLAQRGFAEVETWRDLGGRERVSGGVWQGERQG